MPSDLPTEPRRAPRVDPVSDRLHHRLTTLYAIDTKVPWRSFLDEQAAGCTGVAEHLRFGRLGAHYREAGSQFPLVLASQEHVHCPVRGPRQEPDVAVAQCRTWLFRVPHGGLVAGLTLDFSGDLRESIPLLEDAYYGETLIGEQTMLDAIGQAAPSGLRPYLQAADLTTHGHQLLFLNPASSALVEMKDGQRTLDHDLIRRLIYRFDAPYRVDSGAIRFPAEANRGMHSLAACGPYFSVFVAQQDYVENAALVAAIQLVGSSALLSETRRHAYAALTDLRALHTAVDESDEVEYRAVRRRLGALSERVGRLELDLSFGIEAYHEIAALVPSLRVSGLHRELFEAAALPDQSRSIAQMLDRLSRAVAAEAASVISSERSRDERRRLIWGVAIGFASFVAIPLTLIFGYFAVATTDVSRNSSLLDVGRYKWIYATVGGVMLLTLCLAFAAWRLTRERE
jgi:hypothetical protein